MNHSSFKTQLPSARTRTHFAFTLVELLVVIAIIALLAAMLLPVLSRAKARAYAVNCLNDVKQLQLAWHLYADENREFIPGNDWQSEAGAGGNARGNLNWLTGWLDPRQANNTDNTNSLLLLDPQWSSLGNYVASAKVYRCPASRVTAMEGAAYYPLARTLSMSGWMGYNSTILNQGYQLFRKTTALAQLSASDALVFVEERDDSIDDGYFAIDMVASQLVNFPSAFHGGAGAVTFADGHSEIHRWRSPEVLAAQQSGVPTVKHEYQPVAANNPDLAWLRAHATNLE
jgi:prepilin-type N-terminal cleavage/methylation domain-containing protein/prepilin-type processing-associated H-X9-DG protein